MQPIKPAEEPKHRSYDVVIIGGAMIGAAVACFTASNPDFSGKILVVEQDPSLEFSSTSRTNSSIRQQFSSEINVRISQFSAQYISKFRQYMENDANVPPISFKKIGYLYLANNHISFNILKKNQQMQASLNTPTTILDANRLREKFPYLNISDILAGSFNNHNEGYFDATTILNCWIRKAKEKGVEFIEGKVEKLEIKSKKIEAIILSNGLRVKAGNVVNATGPRAPILAKETHFDLPIEARKRFTFLFKSEKSLKENLPLIIDPSGVHVRSDGNQFLCGCAPEIDREVAFDDFSVDYQLWETKVWPILAHRIPVFEKIKLSNAWAGHYAFNTFDQNAIIGPHPEINNFFFANGFSGHGLQQSPAVGRGISELIIYNQYINSDRDINSWFSILYNIALAYSGNSYLCSLGDYRTSRMSRWL